MVLGYMYPNIYPKILPFKVQIENHVHVVTYWDCIDQSGLEKDHDP